MPAQLRTAIVMLTLLGGCRTTDVHEVTTHSPTIEGDSPIAALANSSGNERALDAEASLLQKSLASPVPLPPVDAVSPVSFQEVVVPEITEIPEPSPHPLLTLAELEEMALSLSPAIAEAAAELEAAYGEWLQAGLPPNPRVGYSGQQLGSGGEAEQQGLVVEQEIITGHKLRLNRASAAWERERAQALLAAQQHRVLTDVRLSYCEVLLAQRRRDLASQLVDVGEKAAEAAETLFRGQEVSEADPLRARIEADTAVILLRNAESQHAAAWRTLAASVGAPDMPQMQLAGEPDSQLVESTWEYLLDQLLTESPEMAAALASVEAAHWALHRAEAEVIPDVQVEAIVQRDNSTDGTNGNLQVTVPVPVLNRNQGAIQEARARLVAAERAVDRLTLDLHTRLADAFQRYESARVQVETYQATGGILDKSERTMTLIRTGYEAGEFGLLDLLTAQRTYFQTNLAYLDSLRLLWSSAIEIRGLLLKGSLTRGDS